MHKKALSAAIATALAAPLAAQAVDFTVSGHVNRALFILDTDGHTVAEVANNGESSTRIRATGSSELMDGNTVGIQFEYEESDASLSLRHANVQYTGPFGRVTIGQGSEAGDGSAYSGKDGTGLSFGNGKHSEFDLDKYFSSLDAGGRKNMVRYDTPAAFGPVEFAVSAANDDSISMRIKGNTSMGDSSFTGQVAILSETATKTTEPEHVGIDGGAPAVIAKKSKITPAKDTLGASMGIELANGFTWSVAWAVQDVEGAKDDPTYGTTTVGYKFGNSAVGVTYWGGENFKNPNSESAIVGIGAVHNLPKAGAQLYIAVHNYDVEDKGAKVDGDETVAVIGTKVSF